MRVTTDLRQNVRSGRRSGPLLNPIGFIDHAGLLTFGRSGIQGVIRTDETSFAVDADDHNTDGDVTLEMEWQTSHVTPALASAGRSASVFRGISPEATPAGE